MPTPSIPTQFAVNAALRARFLQGWRDSLAGHKHLYSTALAPDIFKRPNGDDQLKAYTAGYDAGVRALSADAG